jgi:hypothetical protein
MPFSVLTLISFDRVRFKSASNFHRRWIHRTGVLSKEISRIPGGARLPPSPDHLRAEKFTAQQELRPTIFVWKLPGIIVEINDLRELLPRVSACQKRR